MKVTGWEIKRIGAVILADLFAMFIIWTSGNVLFQVLAFGLACFVPIKIANFDIFHPYCWFSGLFFIYSVSYPLLYLAGYGVYGYNKVILLYQLLGLMIALIIISPKSVFVDREKALDRFAVNTGVLNRLVYIFMAAVVVVGAFYIRRRGFANKSQIYSNTGILMKIVFRMPLIISILCPFLIFDKYKKTKRIPVKDILVALLSIMTLTALSGERDLLFRFVLILGLILFYIGVIKRRHFIIIFPLAILSFPLSAIYKYYFLSGDVAAKKQYGIWYSFLTSDFNAASQNLQYLVDKHNTKGLVGWGRFVKDILSIFLPQFQSLTSWYNKTYFPNSKSGKGFTLVGEGYVIGGVWGIIVVFVIAGLIIRFFYRNSQKSIWFFSAYLYFIPLIIYSIRGDLSTIYAGVIKQIVVVELLIFILMKYAVRTEVSFHEKE